MRFYLPESPLELNEIANKINNKHCERWIEKISIGLPDILRFPKTKINCTRFSSKASVHGWQVKIPFYLRGNFVSFSSSCFYLTSSKYFRSDSWNAYRPRNAFTSVWTINISMGSNLRTRSHPKNDFALESLIRWGLASRELLNI